MTLEYEASAFTYDGGTGLSTLQTNATADRFGLTGATITSSSPFDSAYEVYRNGIRLHPAPTVTDSEHYSFTSNVITLFGDVTATGDAYQITYFTV